MKELQIQFFGRVQAVTFRHQMANIAKNLNINGYVENKEDGSVFCLAQGEESALEEFLQWGQRFSFPVKLTGLNFEWNTPTKKYNSFKVKFNKTFLEDETQGLISLGKRLLIRDNLNVPNHVVVIPDGNRRWARAQGWLPYVGHKRAINSKKLEDMLNVCKDYGVNYFSFWGFSTENWDRDTKEITVIFDLVKKLLPELEQYLHDNKIRFRHFGRKDRLPSELIAVMQELEQNTKAYSSMNFQLCLDYGGRYSIIEAVNKMLEEGLSNVSEKDLKNHLESFDVPDPDLIIRTSGEKRTSGIMAYEAVYAELYFTNVMFPDFDSIEFQRALLDYSARIRRFGGTNKLDFKNLKNKTLIDPDI